MDFHSILSYVIHSACAFQLAIEVVSIAFVINICWANHKVEGKYLHSIYLKKDLFPRHVKM